MRPTPPDHPRAGGAWAVLRVILAVEVVGGAALLWTVTQAFFAASDDPLGARVSVLLAVLLAWVWLGATLWGALAGRRSWARGSALTIHVLIFAGATGVLQGLVGEQATLGWALLLLALGGFVAAVLARPAAPEAVAPEPGAA